MNRRAFFGLFAGVAAALGFGCKAVAAAAPKTDEVSFSYYFVTEGGKCVPASPSFTFVVSDMVPRNTIEFINTDLWKVHLAK